MPNSIFRLVNRIIIRIRMLIPCKFMYYMRNLTLSSRYISVTRPDPFQAQTESGYIEEIGTPSPQPVNSPSSTSSDTPSFLRRNFVTRMRRGGFSSKAEYEMVSCSGHLRRWNEVTRNSPVETVEMLPLDGYCLVGVGRLQCNQTIREMTPSVPTLNEWTSYHSPDAKFIHVDQK